MVPTEPPVPLPLKSPRGDSLLPVYWGGMEAPSEVPGPEQCGGERCGERAGKATGERGGESGLGERPGQWAGE